MKPILLCFMCLLLTGVNTLFAQQGRVSGVVTESDIPLAGVAVILKGTTTGVETDVDGRYSIAVPANAVLVFSFMGMNTQEIPVNSRTVIDVKMQTSAVRLDEVVVTAMGITRDQKAVGYAVQSVRSEELTQGANSDLAGALQGKMSGLSIRPSSGMPGASSQITIRGVRSFSGDNAPLYVIDGMPVASNPDVSTGSGVSGTDYANRAVDIDPNDIASITVLKGQAASALYGIRASNGVIIITTKSGKGLAQGNPLVTFSSNVSFDIISRYPKLQTTYAQGSSGKYDPLASFSWGPKISDLPDDPTYGGNAQGRPGMYYVPQRANAGLDPWAKPTAYDNMKNYFNTGVTWNNFVNVAQSMGETSYAFSIGTSNQKGIIPTTGMDRYNFKLTGQTKLWDNFTTGATANFVSTSIKKMPSANDGIMATIYPAPPSFDLNGIPQHYAGDPYKINNYRGGSFPPAYWSLDNTEFTEKTNRFYGNAFLEYMTKFNTENHKLTAKYQFGADAYISNYKDLWGYGIKGANNNGQVENYNWTNLTFNSLLTVNYNWKINEDFSLDALLGNEIVQSNQRYLYEYGANFQFPGWNHIGNATAKDNTEEQWQNRTVGFFANLEFAYKGMLFLNLTGRNDYVSNMPAKNRSFFYPSVSLGFVFTELESLKDNPVLSYGKVRASFAEVGQAGSYRSNYYYVPGYGSGFFLNPATPIMYPMNGMNAYVPYYTIYDPNLKPQNTQSYELGVELSFWQNFLSLNYTYSRQNVKDQIFSVPLAGSAGASSMLTNGGSLYTNSHELTLGMNPIRSRLVNWNFAFNFTKLDNYVEELAPGVESIFLGGFVTPQVRAGIGYKYPVIYGTGYKRNAQGNILVDAQGRPMAGDPQVIGNVSPDFTLGFNTNLHVWKFDLGVVLDWKCGGQMYSGTNGLLDYYGMSENTANRAGSFVYDGYKANGAKNDIAITGATAWQSFYNVLNNIDESSIYNNSFVKLRELTLNYEVLKNDDIVLNVNAFARNILIWSNLPNLDPESSQGNTNMVGAFERFSLPQTSNYGFGLTLKF